MKITMIFAAAALLCSLYSQAQPGVAVNADGSLPNSSAILDVKSGTKGVLVPRMTSVQRTQIASPATGLLVYQTDAPGGYYWYNGTSWKRIFDAQAGTSNPPVNNLLTFDGTNWIAKALIPGLSGGAQPVSNMQPYLTMNYCIALYGIFPSRSTINPFVGEIQLFGFAFPPSDYLTCSGQLMSINQNMALFALLGTMYGGNGQTTFALPDLRSRVAINQGQGVGLSDTYIGEQYGFENMYLTVSNLPAHTHVVTFQ